MSKTLVLSSAAIGILVAAVALSMTSRAAGDPESLKGKPAPAIGLTTLDGKQVALADLKGKVVLVDTWATWCPPCKASLPHIQKVATDKALADKGLVVWAVDDRETRPQVEAFMKDNKFTFTVLMDGKGTVLKSYLISGIPTTIVVGRDGTVKDTIVGYEGDATAKEIDAALNKALAEPAPGKKRRPKDPCVRRAVGGPSELFFRAVLVFQDGSLEGNLDLVGGVLEKIRQVSAGFADREGAGFAGGEGRAKIRGVTGEINGLAVSIFEEQRSLDAGEILAGVVGQFEFCRENCVRLVVRDEFDGNDGFIVRQVACGRGSRSWGGG